MNGNLRVLQEKELRIELLASQRAIAVGESPGMSLVVFINLNLH